jgi:hypothetical protein
LTFEKLKKSSVILIGVLLLSGIVFSINIVCALQLVGNLEGTVTDAESGEPISGVTITAIMDTASDPPGLYESGSATTDLLGKYSIEDLYGNHPIGESYTVTAEKTGYVTQDITGVLIYSANDPPSIVTTQDIQLQRIQAHAIYGSTPTLDGVVDPVEEWGDAEAIVFAEGVYVKKNCSHLHIGFMVDISDGFFDEDVDRSVVLFDVNHDNGTAPKVDDLRLVVYFNGTLAELHGTGSDWTMVTPSGWKGYSADSGSEHCYEYSIPYSKIGVTSGEADILGFALGYYSIDPRGEALSFWWPKTVAKPNQPDTWTDLIFAPKPTIESCDSMGVTKNSFDAGENLYVKGLGYSYPSWILVTITKDITWVDQMEIPVPPDEDCIWGETGFQSNPAGELIPSTFIWLELAPGQYDIVVDVNDNGVYDECVDALDDFDVESAGFFVVPEIAIGSIMAVAAMFSALGLFTYKKRTKPTK